jgi:hypothetical protein
MIRVFVDMSGRWYWTAMRDSESTVVVAHVKNAFFPAIHGSECSHLSQAIGNLLGYAARPACGAREVGRGEGFFQGRGNGDEEIAGVMERRVIEHLDQSALLYFPVPPSAPSCDSRTANLLNMDEQRLDGEIGVS